MDFFNFLPSLPSCWRSPGWLGWEKERGQRSANVLPPDYRRPSKIPRAQAKRVFGRFPSQPGSEPAGWRQEAMGGLPHGVFRSGNPFPDRGVGFPLGKPGFLFTPQRERHGETRRQSGCLERTPSLGSREARSGTRGLGRVRSGEVFRLRARPALARGRSAEDERRWGGRQGSGYKSWQSAGLSGRGRGLARSLCIGVPWGVLPMSWRAGTAARRSFTMTMTGGISSRRSAMSGVAGAGNHSHLPWRRRRRTS